MPRYCCIPNCTSNRPGKEYVTCFRFPKDAELCSIWKKKIPRSFEVKPDSVVCAKHFVDDDILRFDTITLKDGTKSEKQRKIPKLRQGAYPCIFPDCPSYMTEIRSQRVVTIERQEKMRKLDDEAINEWIEKDKINSFSTLAEELSDKLSPKVPFKLGNEVLLHACNQCVTFVFFLCSTFPKVTKSLKIDSNLIVSFTCNDIVYSDQSFTDIFKISNQLSSWSQLENLLNYAKNYSVSDSLKYVETDYAKSLKSWNSFIDNECAEEKIDSAKFIQEQMFLLNKSAHARRYSTDLLTFAYCIYIKSTAAYKYLYSTPIIVLPSLRHLKRISSNIKVTPGISTNENFSFLKGRCNSLSEDERIVNLQIDEIHIKPCLTFKSQTVTGYVGNGKSLATKVQTFMISSLLCRAKEIVALVPVCKQNANELYEYIINVLQMLETIGFTVLCILSDNNRINRNMFDKLCGSEEITVCILNPVNPLKKLFISFDSVHLIKSIRNNWVNQKDDAMKFIMPDPTDYFNFDICNNSDVKSLATISASFALLKKIYNEESKSLLKFAPKLNLKALNPSSIEKQNVSLALKIFDSSNVCTLRVLKERENCIAPKLYENTACFMEKIITWWQIMNVKTPNKGRRLRLPYSNPISLADSSSLKFLESFAAWIKRWESMKQQNRRGGLTRETFFALHHSTVCMKSIAEYLLNELKLPYVLCGKFQTDNLESRFGQYRQMSGGNYYISLQQILEAEKKLRIKSLLIVKSKKYGNFSISDLVYSHSYEDTSSVDVTEFLPILDEPKDLDDLSKNDAKVLAYIGGYCVFKLQLHCEICSDDFVTPKDLELNENLTERIEYLQIMDRGGLKIPSINIIISLSISYQIFIALISEQYESDFLKCKNQIMLLVNLTLCYLEDYDLINLDGMCEGCNKSLRFYLTKIIRTFSNICINNYVKKCNNIKDIKKDERKLKKLQNDLPQNSK